MTRSKCIFYILQFFVLSVLLRIPNLDRPVSKHHEFNTAVVLINLESWRQAGGGSVFHFVPLLNFQNPGDKTPDLSPAYADKKGNVMYLSYGPGWFVLPYFIYELLHLPNHPVYLQIINLIFNLAAVILFFYLLELIIPAQSEKKYVLILASSFLFMFLPATLWYFGNGYINIDVMLPFVIAFFLLLIPMLRSASAISLRKLFLLSTQILILVYLDWFVLVPCVITGVYLLFKIRRDKKYFLLLLTMIISCVTGVLLLLWQFASYAGRHAVFAYLFGRFNNRSIVNSDSTFLVLLKMLAQNFITSFFPVVLLLAGVYFLMKSKRIEIVFSENEKLFAVIYSLSVSLYNFSLLQWSAAHEFAVLPWSILFAYITARIAVSVFPEKSLYIFASLFFIVTISQYYFINPPGKISREGTPYTSYKEFGEQLTQIPKDCKIFSDLETSTMIEYYAKRNITPAVNYDSAKNYILRWNISKAVWIEHNKFDFKKIITIR